MALASHVGAMGGTCASELTVVCLLLSRAQSVGAGGRDRAADAPSARADETGHVGRETNVLRYSTERFEPAAVLAAKGEDEDQIPMAGEDEYCGEREMAEEHESRPIAMFTTQ